MRLLATALFATVSLIACQTGGDLGGGDPGWELDDAPFSTPESAVDTGSNGSDSDDFLRAESLTVTDATCDESSEELPQSLTATVDGTSVTFVHAGIGTWCSAAFTATASVRAGELLFIDYGDTSGTTAETAECWCQWTVSYTVSDLTPGTWSATALDDTTSFTIE